MKPFWRKVMKGAGATVLVMLVGVAGAFLLDFTGEKIGLARLVVEESNRIIKELRGEVYPSDKHYDGIASRLSAATLRLEEISNRPVVVCPASDIQGCVDSFAGTNFLIQAPSGEIEVEPIVVPTGAAFRIPDSTTLRLSGDTDFSAYCKSCPRGDLALISIKGRPSQPSMGATIVLDGKISAPKEGLPPGVAYEGVSVKYAEKWVLAGHGTVEGIEGDCVDIDASSEGLVMGLRVQNCSGAGVHFGSERPLWRSSSDNLVISVLSISNGFGRSRSGFDAGWTNHGAVTYLGNCASGNYRNWELQDPDSYTRTNYSGRAGHTPDIFEGLDVRQEVPFSVPSCASPENSQ